MKVAAHLLFFFVKMADVPVNKDPVATLQYLLGPLPQLKVLGHLPSHINNVWTVGGVGWKSLRSATFVLQWTYRGSCRPSFWYV